MKISWSSIPGKIKTYHGYGRASAEIIRNWKQQGIEVPFRDITAGVQVHFSQADYYRFWPTQYKIGYTPWESSQLPYGWTQIMNQCDEIFATSRYVQSIYESNGVYRPIYVFRHGVGTEWHAPRRNPSKQIRFLQDGSEPRKGADLAVRAFLAAFGDRSDVSLTVKGRENRRLPIHSNVTYITETLSDEEMVDLYHSHDVFLNLSYGEGFGFPGLQGIVSSMPTLTTSGWADYADLSIMVPSRLVDSPWPKIHPGRMLEPDYDAVIELMCCVVDDFDTYADTAAVNAQLAGVLYSWPELCADAAEHIRNVTGLT